ncbi:hypothetical protein EGW08_000593, partial [Elysia chlorotica]
EYGDLFELCKKDQCTNYEEDYARENCCDTCAELLFTIPSTIATTPTTIITTTTTATPFESRTVGAGGNDVTGSKRNVTSQGGRGGGGKDGGQFESETGDGEEGGDGNDDDTDETGRRRGTFNRRRGYIDSDESDESDESGRREYGRRNYNKRTKPYWANERMVQIHSLLDGMRRSRDYTRMQRLRMLIYILDKTQNEDLADLI